MVFNEYMPHLQVTLSWLLIIVELWVNSRKQFVSNTFLWDHCGPQARNSTQLAKIDISGI